MCRGKGGLVVGDWAFWVLLAIAATWCWRQSGCNVSNWFLIFSRKQQQQSPPARRTKQELVLDAESRQKAKLAALERQKEHETRLQRRRQRTRSEKTSRSRQLQDTTISSPSTVTTTIVSQPTFPVTVNDTPFSLPLVAEHDGIRFYHMSHLRHAHQAAGMMRRIAHEFMPIIRRRGYNILSVSEMCCCGDGLDTGELGGHTRRIQRGVPINGVDQDYIFGYNRTMNRGAGARTRHTIHLRLRHQDHHDSLFSYESVALTMCHELAHCVHSGHSLAFYQLEAEIQEEYASRRRKSDQAYNNNNNTTESSSSSSSLPGGFNVYQSRTTNAGF